MSKLVVVKAVYDLKEIFAEVVCDNLTDDPDQAWLRVCCYDCEDDTMFELDASEIIEIMTYE